MNDDGERYYLTRKCMRTGKIYYQSISGVTNVGNVETIWADEYNFYDLFLMEWCAAFNELKHVETVEGSFFYIGKEDKKYTYDINVCVEMDEQFHSTIDDMINL